MSEANEEMIFVTWALGPSYRYRMKQFIKYNRSTTSCNNVKYLIFTDDTTYFDYLKDKPEIPVIEVVNIFDFMKSRNIELAHNEYLPQATDGDWAETSRKHWGEFSYPAKRVIFLKLYELNITKFALIDPDVYVNPSITKQQLYDGLDIPPNSVSVMGNVPMRIDWNDNTNRLELTAPRSMDNGTSTDFYRAAYFLLYTIRNRVKEKYGYDIPLKEYNYYHTFNLSEGIFHYHHFSDREKLLQYYHVCDETVRFLYSTEYRSVTTGPGWLIPDFTVLCLTNILCDIQICEADKPLELFFGMLFYEDKYVMPNTNGFWPGNTLQEFAEINKEILNKEYFGRPPQFGWWNFLRDFNIIDVEKYRDFIAQYPQHKEVSPEYYDESWLSKRDD